MCNCRYKPPTIFPHSLTLFSFHSHFALVFLSCVRVGAICSMAILNLSQILLVTMFNDFVHASVASTPHAVAPQDPMITPYRVIHEPTKTVRRRNILSSLASDVTSVLSAIGSDIPSYVASGNFLRFVECCVLTDKIIRCTKFLPRFPDRLRRAKLSWYERLTTRRPANSSSQSPTLCQLDR